MLVGEATACKSRNESSTFRATSSVDTEWWNSGSRFRCSRIRHCTRNWFSSMISLEYMSMYSRYHFCSSSSSSSNRWIKSISTLANNAPRHTSVTL